jgi:AbrB family looped-hinge helix DNA binding protein
MTRVRLLRGGQVTLPVDVRQKLNLTEGDFLEAELVESGVLLRPLSDIERERAWERILKAPEDAEYLGPQPRPAPEEEEEWLAAEIKTARLEEHGKRRR